MKKKKNNRKIVYYDVEINIEDMTISFRRNEVPINIISIPKAGLRRCRFGYLGTVIAKSECEALNILHKLYPELKLPKPDEFFKKSKA